MFDSLSKTPIKIQRNSDRPPKYKVWRPERGPQETLKRHQSDQQKLKSDMLASISTNTKSGDLKKAPSDAKETRK